MHNIIPLMVNFIFIGILAMIVLKIFNITYKFGFTTRLANEASCRVAERAGFELFEKRYPISHKQPNMESDCYYYYRKYR